MGPAGLPKAVVTKLNQEVNRYTTSAQGRAKFSQFALVPANGGPDVLATLMNEEASKWAKVVEAAKISLQ